MNFKTMIMKVLISQLNNRILKWCRSIQQQLVLMFLVIILIIKLLHWFQVPPNSMLQPLHPNLDSNNQKMNKIEQQIITYREPIMKVWLITGKTRNKVSWHSCKKVIYWKGMHLMALTATWTLSWRMNLKVPLSLRTSRIHKPIFSQDFLRRCLNS